VNIARLDTCARSVLSHTRASTRQARRLVCYSLFMATKIKRIGILTAGGDSPGLNAAIRGVGKAALGSYGMETIGFRDGFRGLVENRRINLDRTALSGILTIGGTILGTSRDKPHRMEIDGRTKDMTGAIKDNLKKWGIDCLVCLGGGGTQKSALRLYRAGINVITLPKTIDNDVAMTDSTFGYATASTLPPRPSIACIAPRIATTALSWSKSWATAPAGLRSAPVSPGARMWSSSPRSPTT